MHIVSFKMDAHLEIWVRWYVNMHYNNHPINKLISREEKINLNWYWESIMDLTSEGLKSLYGNSLECCMQIVL